MNNIKKLILIISIICVIIIGLIVVLIKIKTDTTNSIDEIEYMGEETSGVYDNSFQQVDSRNNFYSVEACIKKFYIYYAGMFSSEEGQDEYQKAVYNMMDDKYKEYKGISENNIIEKMPEFKESKVNINEMYFIQKTQNMYVYFAKGRLRELGANTVSDFEIMVTIDSSNRTFEVCLEDYIKEKYNEIAIGDELKIDTLESIEINDDNKYDYKTIDEDTYATDLLARYKEEVLFDVENAYNHLDEEYREKRFGSLDEFKTYAQQNIYKNVTLKLQQYRTRLYNEYTEYICMDQNNNYYIFKEKNVMNYGMLLDTYTIDLPDFITKYDSQENEQKVALNVDKIVSAINEKDYKYVYSKLNATYKNKYFSNYDTFVQIMKNNFYDSNELAVEKCESVGQNTYTATIKLTNSKDETQTKSIVVTVKLLDDRNFEMSFAIA